MSEDSKVTIAVSESLDYSRKEISAGSYTFYSVSPEVPSSTTLNLDSTQSCDFLLPNQSLNLSRSYLNMDVVIPAQAAGTYAKAHSGFLACIDAIMLSTAGNVKLLEINNIPEWTKLAWRPLTDYQKYMTHPCHTPNIAAAADVPEAGQLFNRSRNLAAPYAAYATLASGTPYQDYPTPGNRQVTAVQDAAWVNGSFHISQEDGLDLTGAAQVSAGDYDAVCNYIGRTAINAPVAYRLRLPLNMIYGSLLALDKDLYFGEQLRLTIRFNAGRKFGYTSVAPAAEAGGAGFGGDNTVIANSAGAGNVSIASVDLTVVPVLSNVQLRVALETNEAVKMMVTQTVQNGSGFKLNFPYLHSWKANTVAAAQNTNNFSRKLNRNHGAKCLRMIAGVFNAANTGARYCHAYNGTCANAGQTKWESYRTYLDSIPRTPDLLRCDNFNAYQYIEDKLKGSVIKDIKEWMAVPAIIEDFSGVSYTKDFVKSDHMNSGLDLSTEREFSLDVTTAAGNATAMPVVMFAVCQKTLTITNQGISVM